MMERLLKTGVRPAAALLFAGVAAVLVVFTLLTAPPGNLTEAQSSGVEVMATSTKVVVDVTGASVGNGNYVSFYVPGYTSTGAQDGNDALYQSCVIDAVELDDAGEPGDSVIATVGATEWHCRAGSSVYGYFHASEALSDFRMTITDIMFDGTVGDESSIAEFTSWQSNDRDAVTSQLTYPTSIFLGGGPGQYDFWRPGRIGSFDDVSEVSPNTGIQVQIRVQRLPMDLPAGSSVVIYLEDDYSVPATIGRRSAWFVFTGVGEPGKTVVSQPGRHYPRNDIELDTDNYFGGGDDHTIRIYVPDLHLGSRGTATGFQAAVAGQTLTLTIGKNAGILNPSEEGTHSIGYAILGPNDPVPSSPTNTLDLRRTYARVGLSDDDDTRGKAVTATGTGFGDGVTATLYMKHYATAGRHPGGVAPTEFASSGDPNTARRGDQATGSIMTLEETCADIITTGTALGTGVVDASNRVEIPFVISNPPFQPGRGNLLCMEDGNGTASETDIEHINLGPSISVTPDDVSAGNIVTITALDFPARSAFRWVEVAGQRVMHRTDSPIGDNGKGSVTFVMPGNLRGTVSLEACWGGASADDCGTAGAKADATIVVSPSQLSLNKIEVRANEGILLRGAGFSTASGDTNDLASITIDDAPMLIAGGNDVADIEVSNSGQFSTTVIVWSDSDNNPALTPGEHRIKVTDKGGYTGLATITVLEPTIKVTPELAGPREYVVISGANWPVANTDGGDLDDVNLNISGGGITADVENTETNNNGEWSIRWRVPGSVAIPSTINIHATYGDTQDITKLGKFRIPSSDLTVTPDTAPEGALINLNGGGFAPFEGNIEIKIGPHDVAVPTGTTTNRSGDLEEVTVRIPALDDGNYTVQLTVGDTVAIAELEVLESVRGSTDLIEGLSPMGDNLVRVFYFNSAIKFWTFYDPRPDFDDLNTQTTLADGHVYWILVDESQTVTLNGHSRTLTCYTEPDGRENCWNTIVW